MPRSEEILDEASAGPADGPAEPASRAAALRGREAGVRGGAGGHGGPAGGSGGSGRAGGSRGSGASGGQRAVDRRTLWLAQLAAWGTFGAVTYLTFLGQLAPEARLPLAVLKLGIRPALGLAASTLLMLGYRRWLEGRRRPGWLAGAAVVGACTGLGVAWLLATHVLYAPFRPSPVPLEWARVPRTLLEYVFVLLAWSAAYFWFRGRQDAARKERQALRAAAAARAAQLELLTRQLGPHFLFNALTSLRGLIREDPARAEAVVGKLAALLRRTVARPASAVGPLSEEIAYAEAYLEVERSRYGAGLEVEIDVAPSAMDASIPAFLLHPLVENAVKHGRAPDGGGPRRVQIRAGLDGNRLRVEVANPGTLERGGAVADAGPGQRGPAGAGVGLRNLRRRLAQYSPGRHALRLYEEDGVVRAVLEVDQASLPRPVAEAAGSAAAERAPAAGAADAARGTGTTPRA